MDLRFLRCNTCGNIIMFQNDAGPTPACCGTKMETLKAGTSDASIEKHVPVVIVEKGDSKEDKCTGDRFTKVGCCDSYVTVKVGASEHVMTDDHYIEWIVLQTNCGVYTKFLEPGDKAEAVFCLTKGEKAEKAYSYCNLHGLWVSEKLK